MCEDFKIASNETVKNFLMEMSVEYHSSEDKVCTLFFTSKVNDGGSVEGLLVILSRNIIKGFYWRDILSELNTKVIQRDAFQEKKNRHLESEKQEDIIKNEIMKEQETLKKRYRICLKR